MSFLLRGAFYLFEASACMVDIFSPAVYARWVTDAIITTLLMGTWNALRARHYQQRTEKHKFTRLAGFPKNTCLLP